MNYKKQYKKLVESRGILGRAKGKTEYFESHHIVPKALGGSNEQENLVLLSGREHYIAHWLLYKIYPNLPRVALAFWRMSIPSSHFTKRSYKITAIGYAAAKVALSNAQRKLNTGRKVNSAHLIKWTKNKNNSKAIINKSTGESYNSAKELWRERYSNIITYTNFNCYLRGKIKGCKINRKLQDLDIYNWQYKDEQVIETIN